MALAAVAALPQLLAWRPWWPRPLCCKCWRGGRGGRGCGAANAGVVAVVVVAAALQMHIWYAHPLPYDGVAFVRLPKVHCVFILARICLSTSSSPAKATLLEQAVAIASKIWHYNQVSLPRKHDCKYVCNILRGTWPAKRWDQKLPILVSGIEAFLN